MRITVIKRKLRMVLFHQAQFNDMLKTKADFMRPLRWLTTQDLLQLVISWADLTNKIKTTRGQECYCWMENSAYQAVWAEPLQMLASIGMHRERIRFIHMFRSHRWELYWETLLALRPSAGVKTKDEEMIFLHTKNKTRKKYNNI